VAPLPDHERLFALTLLPYANSGRPQKDHFMQTAVIGAGLAGLNGACLPQLQDNIDNKPT
jgi:hypothetical protein